MLKLYVWEEMAIATHWVAFALAESEEEARRLIVEADPSLKEEEYFTEPPKVYDTPKGFAIDRD